MFPPCFGTWPVYLSQLSLESKWQSKTQSQFVTMRGKGWLQKTRANLPLQPPSATSPTKGGSLQPAPGTHKRSPQMLSVPSSPVQGATASRLNFNKSLTVFLNLGSLKTQGVDLLVPNHVPVTCWLPTPWVCLWPSSHLTSLCHLKLLKLPCTTFWNPFSSLPSDLAPPDSSIPFADSTSADHSQHSYSLVFPLPSFLSFYIFVFWSGSFIPMASTSYKLTPPKPTSFLSSRSTSHLSTEHLTTDVPGALRTGCDPACPQPNSAASFPSIHRLVLPLGFSISAKGPGHSLFNFVSSINVTNSTYYFSCIPTAMTSLIFIWLGWWPNRPSPLLCLPVWIIL